MIPYVVMALGVLVLVVGGIRNYVSAIHERADPFRGIQESYFRFYNTMPSTVSLTVLLAALYVLVFTDDDPQWATGAVGTILGYWLPNQHHQ